MADVKIGSNRSFGIVFFIVFLLISIYPLINETRPMFDDIKGNIREEFENFNRKKNQMKNRP